MIYGLRLPDTCNDLEDLAEFVQTHMYPHMDEDNAVTERHYDEESNQIFKDVYEYQPVQIDDADNDDNDYDGDDDDDDDRDINLEQK